MNPLGVAKGIGWGLSALGAAGSVAGLNSYGKDRRKELVRQGPDEFGDYDLQLGDRLFVDTDSLEDSSNKVKMDKAKKDGRVRSAQRMDPSLQLTNGMDAEDFLDTYASDIRKLELNESIEEDSARRTAAFKDPQMIEERRVQAELRNDTLRQNALTRQDTQQARLDEVEYRRLQDAKDDRRYNESIERMNTKDRRAAMSSLGAGLAALGAAFAI